MLEFNSCGTGCELPHGFSMVALATKLRNCRRPWFEAQKGRVKSCKMFVLGKKLSESLERGRAWLTAKSRRFLDRENCHCYCCSSGSAPLRSPRERHLADPASSGFESGRLCGSYTLAVRVYARDRSWLFAVTMVSRFVTLSALRLATPPTLSGQAEKSFV